MYWCWVVVLFVLSARDATDMAALFKDKLSISNRELQTIEWHEVVTRLEALQRSGKYTIAITGGSFTARDIACRIMRKEVKGLVCIYHLIYLIPYISLCTISHYLLSLVRII